MHSDAAASPQGLGKTVSTIALIVTNRPAAKQQGQARLSAGAGSSALLASQGAAPGRKRRQPEPSAGKSALASGGGSRRGPGGSDSDDEDGRGSGSSDDEFPGSSQDGSPAAANGGSDAAAAAAATASTSSDSVLIISSDSSEDEDEQESVGRFAVRRRRRHTPLPSFRPLPALRRLAGAPPRAPALLPSTLRADRFVLLPSPAGRHAGGVPLHCAAPVGSRDSQQGQPTCRHQRARVPWQRCVLG